MHGCHPWVHWGHAGVHWGHAGVHGGLQETARVGEGMGKLDTCVSEHNAVLVCQGVMVRCIGTCWGAGKPAENRTGGGGGIDKHM